MISAVVTRDGGKLGQGEPPPLPLRRDEAKHPLGLAHTVNDAMGLQPNWLVIHKRRAFDLGV